LVFVRCSYLKILGSLAPSLPKGTLKRNAERSDSIRSIGFAEDHRFNVRWLKEACRILKPEGTIWVTGTHHIIFSLGFALQTMKFRLINQITWAKPDPPPNALHTAFTHSKAVEPTPAGASPRTSS
jgi:DNA modification methylase